MAVAILVAFCAVVVVRVIGLELLVPDGAVFVEHIKPPPRPKRLWIV